MADKVVMGDQQDGLRGLTRFSDNEGEIIWPAWRAELKQRVSFEFGKIGNQIIEGEVKEEDVDHGEVTADINSLINSLIPKTRAQIQTRSDWMQELVVSSGEEEDGEPSTRTTTKLSTIGKMSIKMAISKIKSSYIMSIQEHGLVKGCKVAKDLAKKKLNYTDTTLPQWLCKMDKQFGVTDSELKDAYVEQMTSLRVLKSQESADVLRNLLGEGGSGDAMDDVCRGFECFNDMKHTIMQLAEGIEDCADKIRTLLGEHEQEPECMQAKIIVPKIIKSIKFVEQYRRPVESYGELIGTDESKHECIVFFEMLHEHETEYRRFKKRRETSAARSTTMPALVTKSDKDKAAGRDPLELKASLRLQLLRFYGPIPVTRTQRRRFRCATPDEVTHQGES